MSRTRFRQVFGVDFSGAKDAGARAWLARLDVRTKRPRLTSLQSLGAHAGSDARDAALGWLVSAIGASKDALWGIDAPLGLPVELFDASDDWRAQLAYVRTFDRADAMGRALVARSLERFGRHHVRRATDVATKTPFDCYHYRIVHQTFAAMHDVLPALLAGRGTAVLPFDYAKLAKAERVVVEACPSSTLKRLGLPHQGYKQPTGAKLDAARSKRRRALTTAIAEHVDVPQELARTMAQNRGGDALDAVVAALGAHEGFAREDHDDVRRDARATREGRVYC